MGVRFADLNGDGLQDLYMLYRGPRHCVDVGLSLYAGIYYNDDGTVYIRNAWINTGYGWRHSTDYTPPGGNVVFRDCYANLWDTGLRPIDLNGELELTEVGRLITSDPKEEK